MTALIALVMVPDKFINGNVLTTAEARIGHMKTTDEYKHTSSESIIRNLPDSTTAMTVNK
jgi:hypothetical protein